MLQRAGDWKIDSIEKADRSIFLRVDPSPFLLSPDLPYSHEMMSEALWDPSTPGERIKYRQDSASPSPFPKTRIRRSTERKASTSAD